MSESDVKVMIRKSDILPNWYVIEYEDGSRFSDACIEGSANEMLQIASAIEKNESIHFRRCGVTMNEFRARFFSPRNSQGDYGTIGLREAAELAKQIKLLLDK